MLRRYDLSGRLRTVVRRLREHLPAHGFIDTRGVFVHTGSYARVSPPLALSSGHWIVHVQWPKPGSADERTAYWSASLDVFDAQGRFLGPSPVKL